jgi:hypothetical protein
LFLISFFSGWERRRLAGFNVSIGDFVEKIWTTLRDFFALFLSRPSGALVYLWLLSQGDE